MATVITDSPDITSLDAKVVTDLCSGEFVIDVTPSVFLSGGTDRVGGASVEISNPVGVLIRGYITSSYDIVPPMTGSVSVAIPLVASNYLYGIYVINVRLTDSLGSEYIVTKSVNICPPDPNDKTKKYGCINVAISGNCKDGKVVIVLNQPPVYKGKMALSQVNDLTIEFPTGSGLEPLETAMGSFSVALFEGIYKVYGTVCVTYDYGENVYFKIPYHVKCEKNIKCILDECCIQDKLKELNDQLKADCTDTEKEKTSSIILQTLFLYKAAVGAANCGLDPSEFISSLEDLLGCVCTCNCNSGTPIINNNPVTDFVFEGCGFEEDSTGNTKTITLNNYDYQFTAEEGSGITIGTPVVDQETCTVTTQIGLSKTTIGGVIYKSVLNQTGTSNPVSSVGINNTARAFLFAYSSVGEYLVTVSGAVLDPLKVHILMGSSTNNGNPPSAFVVSDHVIAIKTLNNSELHNTTFWVEFFD